MASDFFTQEWTKEGLDRVELAEYDFYLSWPNETNPNFIRLLDKNGILRIGNIFVHKKTKRFKLSTISIILYSILNRRRKI